MPRQQFSLKWLLGLVFWLAALAGWFSFLRDLEQGNEQRQPKQHAERLTEIEDDGK